MKPNLYRLTFKHGKVHIEHVVNMKDLPLHKIAEFARENAKELGAQLVSIKREDRLWEKK